MGLCLFKWSLYMGRLQAFTDAIANYPLIF
jgi:hypothetical protein